MFRPTCSGLITVSSSSSRPERWRLRSPRPWYPPIAGIMPGRRVRKRRVDSTGTRPIITVEEVGIRHPLTLIAARHELPPVLQRSVHSLRCQRLVSRTQHPLPVMQPVTSSNRGQGVGRAERPHTVPTSNGSAPRSDRSRLTAPSSRREHSGSSALLSSSRPGDNADGSRLRR